MAMPNVEAKASTYLRSNPKCNSGHSLRLSPYPLHSPP